MQIETNPPKTTTGVAPSKPVFAWSPPVLGLLSFILLGLFLWAYWPTLGVLARAWETQPDYSHGWFVVPMALLACYLRRGSFPSQASPSLGAVVLGLLLIGIASGMRVGSGLIYLQSLDGWSIPFWVAGIVCLLLGVRALYWSLPSIAFLFFMIPMPFRAERMLSYPLQRVAAQMSCAALQTLGQPALAENNVIMLGDHQLEVAQACSGLRIFISVAALAFAVIVMIPRPWWQRLIIAVSVGPIALVVNSMRIVVTGLLYQMVSGEAAEKFSHDLAGYMMIPVAGVMFLGVLWYVGSLVQKEEEMGIGEVVGMRKGRDENDPSQGGVNSTRAEIVS